MLGGPQSASKWPLVRYVCGVNVTNKTQDFFFFYQWVDPELFRKQSLCITVYLCKLTMVTLMDVNAGIFPDQQAKCCTFTFSKKCWDTSFSSFLYLSFIQKTQSICSRMIEIMRVTYRNNIFTPKHTNFAKKLNLYPQMTAGRLQNDITTSKTELLDMPLNIRTASFNICMTFSRNNASMRRIMVMVSLVQFHASSNTNLDMAELAMNI